MNDDFLFSLNQRKSAAFHFLDSQHDLILDAFEKGPSPSLKEDGSFVTETDCRVEMSFREQFGLLFKSDGIVGEEFKEDNKRGEWTWTIDPIDGTSSFAHGVPFFGTMIGLLFQETSVFGVIDFQALGERVFAEKGKGAFWRAGRSKRFEEIKVSETSALDKKVFSYSGPEYFKKDEEQELLKRLRSRFFLERMWGDCYGHCLVARGKVDLMIDPLLYEWDRVPLEVILKEAGGHFISSGVLSNGGASVTKGLEILLN